jgi:hypothetical protein
MLKPGLTKPQGEEMARMQEQTAPGMAHWSGSGPLGTTCRECVSWGWSKKFRRDSWGELSPRLCSKFIRLSGGKKGDPVHHSKWSCKYFEAAPSAPEPMKSKGRE